jgi:hypothetical protein
MAGNKQQSTPKKPTRDLAPRKLAEAEKQQVKGGKVKPGSQNFEHYFDRSS